MLDDFMMEQGVVCNIMKNSVINGRCSHAYLINTNGYSKGFDMALAFAKFILCPNKVDCGDCNQCRLIDEGAFPELKIIRSDGVWIKKEQMDILQAEFSKTSIGSDKRVYIIDGAENLNISASNSILKFLEEPVEGIVAILVTDNIYKVLSTIVSRCQILNLNNVLSCSDDMIRNVACSIFNDVVSIDGFINDKNSRDIVKNVVDFIVYLEKNCLDTIVYIDSVWNCFFKSKEDYMLAFNIMIIFYSDVLGVKMGKALLLCDYGDVIDEFVDLDYLLINKRIGLLMEFKNRIYSNVNLSLLMDKFIIEMGALNG